MKVRCFLLGYWENSFFLGNISLSWSNEIKILLLCLHFFWKFFYFIRKFLGWNIIPCKIHGIICPTIWLFIFYHAYFLWKFFYFVRKFLGWNVAIQPLWYTESHDSRTGHMSFWLCISCQFFNGFNSRTDHVDSFQLDNQ